MTPRRLVALAGALLLTGCATTIDESLVSTTSTAPAVSTSTTLPSGDAATLLPQMIIVAADMSRRVRENDGDQDALAEINALWFAARQEVGRTHPELLGSFQGQLDLMARSVQFNRPADADKAYRNLDALVDAVLA
jgi:hypothetical protein